MRKTIIPLALVLLALTACNTNPNTTEQVELVETNTVTFTYAQELGDVVLNYYLGRDYDEAYTNALGNITRLADDDRIIYMDTDIDLVITQKLSSVVLASMKMPGSPVYRDVVDDGSGASGGDHFTSTELESMDSTGDVKIKKLVKKLFPDGTAPSIEPIDIYGNISSEFKEWFLTSIVELGYLDSRIKLDSDNKAYVYSSDCTESKGGNKFKIFDTVYSIPTWSLGVTTEEVATYQMELESYRFYDAGLYQAIYGNGSKQIIVTFVVEDTTQSDLAMFIDSITNMAVTLQEG